MPVGPSLVVASSSSNTPAHSRAIRGVRQPGGSSTPLPSTSSSRSARGTSTSSRAMATRRGVPGLWARKARGGGLRVRVDQRSSYPFFEDERALADISVNWLASAAVVNASRLARSMMSPSCRSAEPGFVVDAVFVVFVIFVILTVVLTDSSSQRNVLATRKNVQLGGPCVKEPKGRTIR